MTRGQYPHNLLPHLNRHRFYLSDIGLYRLSYRKAVAKFVRPGYTYTTCVGCCAFQPPRINGVKVHTDDTRRNEVVMDMEIE